jgi:UDPglucose--hexose-1-phosphate uridylyltransferase
VTSVAFRAECKTAQLHDPRRNFELVTVQSEVRADPLTGDSARICHFALNAAPPGDLAAIVSTSAAHCPFCPGKIDAITPRYPDAVLPGGRLRRGAARLFPNLFPYDEYSAIVVLCEEHFHAMDAIPPRLVVDGLTAARDFVRAVAPAFAGRKAYGIVTWNYMPAAGATQVHPHMQVIVTANPGNALRRQLDAERAWLARAGRPYADMLRDAERDGPRWIGEADGIAWSTPFAPAGLLGDVQGIFANAATLADLGDADIAAFADGLVRMLRGFAGRGLWSFNLCLLPDAFGADDGAHRLVARLLPRLYLNPTLHVSDVAYMHLLLDEKFAMAWPETVAEHLRAAWSAES